MQQVHKCSHVVCGKYYHEDCLRLGRPFNKNTANNNSSKKKKNNNDGDDTSVIATNNNNDNSKESKEKVNHKSYYLINCSVS